MEPGEKLPAEGEARMTMRSRAQQARSRERLDGLLAIAEQLLSEAGVDGFKMRDLARRAEVPIASLYHYFPSASAVVRALGVRHLEELRAFLLAGIGPLAERGNLAEAAPEVIAELIDAMVAFLTRSPATTAIWDALRASPELRALDFEDTAESARLLEPLLTRAAPGLAPSLIPAMSRVLVEAVQGNMLVIMRTPEPGRAALIDALKRFVIAAVVGVGGG